MSAEIELLTLIADLNMSKDVSRKAIGAEVKRLVEQIRKDDKAELARQSVVIEAVENALRDYNNGELSMIDYHCAVATALAAVEQLTEETEKTTNDT